MTVIWPSWQSLLRSEDKMVEAFVILVFIESEYNTKANIFNLGGRYVYNGLQIMDGQF